jgi:hypothetical protein
MKKAPRYRLLPPGAGAAAGLLLTLFSAGTARAQGTRTDYARAEQLIGWNARELVINDAVDPRWLAGDRFWYRKRSTKGYEFVMVDAATGTKRPVFDHVKLASALSEAADTAYDPFRLPFRDFVFTPDGKGIRFGVGGKRWWACDVTAYTCTGPDTVPNERRNEVRSPV